MRIGQKKTEAYLLKLARIQKNRANGITEYPVGAVLLAKSGRVYTGHNGACDNRWLAAERPSLEQKAAYGDKSDIEIIVLEGKCALDMLGRPFFNAAWLEMPGVTSRTRVVLANSSSTKSFVIGDFYPTPRQRLWHRHSGGHGPRPPLRSYPKNRPHALNGVHQ